MYVHQSADMQLVLLKNILTYLLISLFTVTWTFLYTIGQSWDFFGKILGFQKMESGSTERRGYFWLAVRKHKNGFVASDSVTICIVIMISLFRRVIFDCCYALKASYLT